MNKPFQIQCPKCQSQNVEIRRERTGWSTGETVVHCRACGKVLYGKPAEEEVRRQKTSWERQQAREEVVRSASRKLPPNLLWKESQAKEFVDNHISNMEKDWEEVSNTLEVVSLFEKEAPVLLRRRPSEVAQGQMNLVRLDRMKIQRIFDEMTRLLDVAVEKREVSLVAKVRAKYIDLKESFARVKEVVDRCVAKFHATLANTPEVPGTPSVEKTPGITEGKRPSQVKITKPMQPLPEKSLEDLGNMTLADLRKYACHNLGIVGASKIPGGKKALLDRINRESKAKPATTSKHPSLENLSQRPLADLRKYACHDLGIVGASKIPGGKKALLDRINQELTQSG